MASSTEPDLSHNVMNLTPLMMSSIPPTPDPEPSHSRKRRTSSHDHHHNHPTPLTPESEDQYDTNILPQSASRSFLSGLRLAVSYIWSEMKRQPTAYIWSMITVFITVFVITVVISAVARSSFIFFRMSEVQVGEQDIVLTPGAGIVETRVVFPTPLPLLNVTEIDMALAGRGSRYEPVIEGYHGNLDDYISGPPDADGTKTPVSFASGGAGPSAYVLRGSSSSEDNGRIFMDAPRTPPASLLAGAAGRQIIYGHMANATLHLSDTQTLQTHPLAPNTVIPELLSFIPESSVSSTTDVLLGALATSSIVAGIDSARERFINLGRVFAEDYDPVPAHSLLASRGTLRELGAPDNVIDLLLEHARARDEALASGTAVGPEGVPLSRDTYYRVFNASTGVWDGDGLVPLLSMRFRLDFAQLLSILGIVDSQLLTEEGAGTTEDPYLVPVVNATVLGDTLDSMAVPAPMNATSWADYLALPATDLIGPPSNWTDWAAVAEAMGDALPAPLNTTSPLDFPVRLEQLYNAWNSTVPDPLRYSLQGEVYLYPGTLPSPFPDSPAEVTLRLLYDAGNQTHSIDTVLLDDTYAAALAAAEAAGQRGATLGDWATPLVSMMLGGRTSTPTAVSGVVLSGDGKYSDSLGNVVLCEIQAVLALVQDTLTSMAAGTVDLGMLSFNVTQFVNDGDYSFGGIPVVLDQDIVVDVGPVQFNPSAAIGVTADAMAGLANAVQAHEMVPSVFAMAGSGGAQRIGAAYDDKYAGTVTASASASTAATRLRRIAPGLTGFAPASSSSSAALACAPCACAYSLGCVLADLHATLRMWAGYDTHAHAATLASASVSATVAATTAPTPAGTDEGLRARQDAYLQAETAMDRAFSGITTSLFRALGPSFPATPTLPLLEATRSSLFMRYFLDAIFITVIFVMLLIAAITTYSLFNTDTEAHAYTYGMLRALGLTTAQLATMLLLKALLVGVVGTLLGLALAALVMVFVDRLLRGETHAAAIELLTGTAVGVSVATGLLVPILATIVPIKRALSSVLVDTLSVHKTALNDLAVTVRKLTEMGLQPYQTVAAVMLIVFGFITFYLIPLSFTDNNIPMFLTLLMVLLMAMLIGLALLSQTIMPWCHKGLAWLFTIRQPATRSLLLKSLPAHTPTNSKLSLLYCITLSFVVFSGSVFRLQAASIGDTLRMFLGSTIVLSTSDTADAPLPVAAVGDYLDSMQALPPSHPLHGVVQAHSFVTAPITSSAQDDETSWRARIAPLAQYPYRTQKVYGLQPSFPQSIHFSLYGDEETRLVGAATGVEDILQFPEEPTPEGSIPPAVLAAGAYSPPVRAGVDGALDAYEASQRDAQVESYTRAVPCVINEALRGVISVDVNTPMTLQLRGTNNNRGTVTSYLARARSMAVHVPGFFFSPYSTLVGSGSVLVSVDNFAYMVGANVTDLTYERAMIKLADTATATQRDDIVQGVMRSVASAMGNQDTIQATDTEALIATMDFAVNTLEIFFTALSGVVMALCFVMTVVTVAANVQQQAWELGVLRALGLQKIHLIWLYMLETLVIALCALASGTLIGLTVAISLALLFNLFTNLPFQMAFPGQMYGLVVMMVIVSSAGAAFVPAYRHTRSQISSALRKN